ncbi:phytanoyl-CoA dioxygenase family protein [Roseibium sp. MMSF_3544]|uniref:phytanoyl-CoA dioxygenase family protein n=1 Tax=unclassified Roseibium TaxID=2629323 RepID=UPI00273FD64E|nr:phytanoyl-CoA dioxygenase family protein [Roseibium sp. MMSF_3544]
MSETTMATFRKNGYAVFPGALSEEELTLLRKTCNTLLDEPVDDGGHSGRHKIGLGQSRRFLAHRHAEFPDVETFLLGEKISGITNACLGVSGQLFNEQFVVKGSGTGASFAWHQDGAYVGFDHTPYLTVWIALDDTTVENGCVYVLPRNLDDKPDLDRHEWQEDSNELNGYFGDETGEPMTCPAGTIVAFSSLTLHRSGPNTTDNPRRAYVCQYSAVPIKDPETGELKRFAKPVAEIEAA